MPVKFWSLLGDAVKPTAASLLPAGLLLLSPIPLHSCFPRVCFPTFHETCTTTKFTLFFGGKAIQVILMSFLCFGQRLLHFCAVIWMKNLMLMVYLSFERVSFSVCVMILIHYCFRCRCHI